MSLTKYHYCVRTLDGLGLVFNVQAASKEDLDLFMLEKFDCKENYIAVSEKDIIDLTDFINIHGVGYYLINESLYFNSKINFDSIEFIKEDEMKDIDQNVFAEYGIYQQEDMFNIIKGYLILFCENAQKGEVFFTKSFLELES